MNKDGPYNGFETVAFCEIEEFPRKVLAKHWPDVPCYRDVRELTAERLAADGIGLVDAICGGFPCQDISVAGAGAGLAGARSGLWSEFARLIGELGPRYVIVENVAALLGRGLGRVLGDMASLGYDAEWHCIPAGAIGAPHIRDRLWIVAYPHGRNDRGEQILGAIRRCESPRPHQAKGALGERNRRGFGHRGQAQNVADPNQARWPDFCWGATLAERAWIGTIGDTSRWQAEPALGRVVDGLPARLDKWRKRSVEGFGNAVVPQIPELIGRAILAHLNPGKQTGSDHAERFDRNHTTVQGWVERDRIPANAFTPNAFAALSLRRSSPLHAVADRQPLWKSPGPP